MREIRQSGAEGGRSRIQSALPTRIVNGWPFGAESPAARLSRLLLTSLFVPRMNGFISAASPHRLRLQIRATCRNHFDRKSRRPLQSS